MRKFWKNLAVATVGVVLSQSGSVYAQDQSDFIRRMDTNGNGMIDPDESQGRARGMLERMSQSNPRINLSRPIPVEMLTREMDRMRSGFGGGQSGQGGRGGGGGGGFQGGGNFGGGFNGGGFGGGGFGGSGFGGENGQGGQRGSRNGRQNGVDSSGNPTPTLVEGFGNEFNDTPVLGFGADQEQNLSGIKPTDDDQRRMERTLRQNDRNGDGVIEGEEISTGRWDDGDPKLYDANRDGRLTKNELLIRAAKKRVTDEAEEKAEREQRSRDRDQRGGDRGGDRFAMFGGGGGGFGGWGGGGFGGGGFGGGGFGGRGSWGGDRGGMGGGPGGNMMMMVTPGGEGGREGREGRGGRDRGDGDGDNEGRGRFAGPGGGGPVMMGAGGPPGMGVPGGAPGMGGPPGMGNPGMGGEGNPWGGRGGMGGEDGGGDRMMGMLEESFARADENNSGSLERDEWRNLRRTSGEDLDKDKNEIITKQEYLEVIGERMGIKVDPAKFAYKPTGPMTYRAREPREKYPDVPAWFWNEDKDGDLQVSMNEHSSNWTDARIAEWLKLDSNGDGVMSMQEAVASTKPVPAGIVVTPPKAVQNNGGQNAFAANGQAQGNGQGQREGGEGRRSRNNENNQPGPQISAEEARELKADRGQRWGQVGNGSAKEGAPAASGGAPSYDVPADLPASIDKNKATKSARFFAQEDKNKDGFLTTDEMENAKDADKNNDGKADLKEWIVFKNS